MVEKIKGISIKGRCFSNDTSLVLYPNNKDRIAVVYGKNGSGKSTISTGFQNVASTTFESDINLKLIDGSNVELNSEDYKNNVFVFNEQYIDRNVKIDDDGLGTIILLGAQVDLQTEIDQHIVSEAQYRTDLEKEQKKFEEYQTATNPLSPEYHLDQIRAILKRPGGWAETESKIKSLKQNAPVRDEVLFEICKLKPTETIDF